MYGIHETFFQVFHNFVGKRKFSIFILPIIDEKVWNTLPPWLNIARLL